MTKQKPKTFEKLPAKPTVHKFHVDSEELLTLLSSFEAKNVESVNAVSVAYASYDVDGCYCCPSDSC